MGTQGAEEQCWLSPRAAARLHDLRWHWGGAYRIICCRSGESYRWTASPHDAPVVVLVASTEPALRRLIRADYNTRQKPRAGRG